VNDLERPETALPDPRDPANQVWTTAQAASRARVSEKTIQKWVDRGKLEPVGELDGQHLFRGGDVLDVEEATRRRPRLAALLAESRAMFRRGDATP
jgi:hypothetical protein